MTTSDFLVFILLTAAMGLSIFLSLPIILLKRLASRTITFLNAIAIGILIFLLADIFSDLAPVIASSTEYFTNGWLDLAFIISMTLIFALLYLIDQRPPLPEPTHQESSPGATTPLDSTIRNPTRLALIIAIGIGLQNLTEGLFFGGNWSTGTIGLLSVTFAGFFLQNVTEGFPIVSPYLGERFKSIYVVCGLFLVGSLPTIAGGAFGYFYPDQNSVFTTVIDALAIGAILYCLLPMVKVALRSEATRLLTYYKHRLVYFGILAGFLLGFAVNAF
ncbi:MAG: ZIP family metal transporter [Thermoplasmata archaeon]